MSMRKIGNVLFWHRDVNRFYQLFGYGVRMCWSTGTFFLLDSLKKRLKFFKKMRNLKLQKNWIEIVFFLTNKTKYFLLITKISNFRPGSLNMSKQIAQERNVENSPNVKWASCHRPTTQIAVKIDSEVELNQIVHKNLEKISKNKKNDKNCIDSLILTGI